MNKIDITKSAVGFIVKSGVTKIANSIIANNVTTESAYQKVAVASAAVVIGMMAGDATKVYTDKKIDSGVQKWHEITNQIQETKTAE